MQELSDRYAWILFGTLVTMCFVIGTVFLLEERPHEDVLKNGTTERVYEGHGIPHPEFEHMLQGGDGVTRHENLLWLGWVFAVLQMTFLTACLSLAMVRPGGAGPAKVPLLAAGLVGACILTFLFLSYREHLAGEETRFFLGFPAPAAWLVFGVWGFPLLFALIYVAVFDRWYLTPEAMGRFFRIRDQRHDVDEPES